jgi:hypothetical protein
MIARSRISLAMSMPRIWEEFRSAGVQGVQGICTSEVGGEVRENLPLKEVRPKRLAKNGQIGWCFDELDEWRLGLFGEIRAFGSGF